MADVMEAQGPAATFPKGRTRVRKPKGGESVTAWLLMAPAALGLLIFVIVPFFMAFYLSFTDTRLMSPNPAEMVGLENKQLLGIKVISMESWVDPDTGEYPRSRTILRSEEYKEERLQELTQLNLFGSRYLVAAGDPVFWQGLLNNFKFVLVVVPLQTAFALLLAILINQKIVGANLYRALYLTPVVVPMVVVAVIWFFLYNPGVGTINSFVQAISFGLVGPQDWLADPRLAFLCIMLVSIWQGVGFQMVIFLAGLQEIPLARIHAERQAEGPQEGPVPSLLAVVGHAFRLVRLAVAPQHQHVVFHCDVDIIEDNTGQLGSDDGPVLIRPHIDGRIARCSPPPGPCRPIAKEPVHLAAQAFYLGPGCRPTCIRWHQHGTSSFFFHLVDLRTKGTRPTALKEAIQA